MDKDIEIEEAIFAFARRIPDRAERERYLREKCDGNPSLRRRIQALLDAYAGADTFLEVPVETTDAFDLAFGESEGVGSVVGSYELVEEIGRGGMGQVFRAMQSFPIRRHVALKTIRLGMDSRENIKRFEAERQAMAQLNHHGVARLLDAGGTSTGRPWFVMELTVGQSITTYCQQNSLPLMDRLYLFESVCEAILHVHQNGVIHCDIKPDNVAVTIVNGKPYCKVIDFGVAILLIAAVVLGGTSLMGGKGTIAGTVLGALTIAVIGNGLILSHVSPFYTQIVTGLIILVAIWLNTRVFAKLATPVRKS